MTSGAAGDKGNKLRRQGEGTQPPTASPDVTAVFDAVDIPIVLVDQKCVVIAFNRAARDVLTLKPSNRGCAADQITALLHVKDFPSLCARVIADDAPCRHEICDGNRWFSLRIAPYRGSDHVEGAVLTFTNITVSRASIQQAIYEREHTKSILNTVIEPLIVVDQNLGVQTANRAFYEAFRCSRDDAQGIPLYNLGSTEWRTGGPWTSLKALLTDNIGFQSCEVECDLPRLGRRTFLFDARRLCREGPLMAVVALQDITERKRAEAGQAALAAIVACSDDAIIGTDLDGQIISWNLGAERLYGYTHEEAIGQSIAILIPADRLEEESNIIARIRRGERCDHYETIRCHKNGTWREISLTVSPILDSNGRVIGASKIARDIRERKQHEQERVRLLSREWAAREEAETLRDICTSLAAELDLDRFLQKLTDAGTSLAGAEFGAFIYNAGPESGKFFLATASGVMPEVFTQSDIGRNTTLLEAAFRGTQVISIDDTADALTDQSSGTNPAVRWKSNQNAAIRSYLTVPVRSRSGEALGGLFFGHSQPRIFNDRVKRLCVAIAAQAAVLIDNARLYDQAQKEIIERRKTEQVLREREAELRDFIENASVGLHWVGPDGIVLWANQTELDMLGYTKDEYIGHHIAEFHADESVIRDILERLTRGETLQDYEACLRCKDGSSRHVLINSNVLFQDEKFLHTRCFTRDVTEQKSAIDALRESERRFRDMIEALPAAIYTTDAEGRLTHFNQAAVELSGRTPELGTDQWCVSWKLYRVDGTPLPHDECPMAIALKEGRIVRGVEAIAERPDGTRFWFLPYPTPLYNDEGRLIGGINMLVDITDSKRAEESLRASEERYRHLYESIDEGFCVIQVVFDARNRAVDYVFLEVNPAFERQTGIPNARGKSMRTIAMHHEEHWFELYGEIAMTGEPKRFEFPATELHRWYEGYAYRLGQPHERKVGILFNDITERKRTEAQLHSINDELEARVTERTRELTQSQQRLRALASELNLAEQRERQRLAADLHDYLGQLLALSRMKLGQAKKQPMETGLAKILDEMLDVTDKALTYTRTLVAQLSPPVLQEFGLPMALQWLAEQMHQRDLVVSVQVNTEMPSLPQDQALLLFQSVRELLINCVKHARASAATVTVDRMSDELRIAVSDEGSGFDYSALGAKAYSTSSGFGLFSIRERMLSLGGRFEIESAPGKGTVAELLLPLSESNSGPSGLPVQDSQKEHVERTGILDSPVPKPADQSGADGSIIRILVADDHAIVRQGLCGLLGQYSGLEVVGEAGNGEEAVVLADKLVPDVVLMDVTMPKMDGIEATGVLKRKHPGMTVIGLSLHTAEQVEAAMTAAGASAFINKEAAVDELHHAINVARNSVRS